MSQISLFFSKRVHWHAAQYSTIMTTEYYVTNLTTISDAMTIHCHPRVMFGQVVQINLRKATIVTMHSKYPIRTVRCLSTFMRLFMSEVEPTSTHTHDLQQRCNCVDAWSKLTYTGCLLLALVYFFPNGCIDRQPPKPTVLREFDRGKAVRVYLYFSDRYAVSRSWTNVILV